MQPLGAGHRLSSLGTSDLDLVWPFPGLKAPRPSSKILMHLSVVHRDCVGDSPARARILRDSRSYDAIRTVGLWAVLGSNQGPPADRPRLGRGPCSLREPMPLIGPASVLSPASPRTPPHTQLACANTGLCVPLRALPSIGATASEAPTWRLDKPRMEPLLPVGLPIPPGPDRCNAGSTRIFLGRRRRLRAPPAERGGEPGAERAASRAIAVYRQTPLLFTQDVGEHDGGDWVDHGLPFGLRCARASLRLDAHARARRMPGSQPPGSRSRRGTP